MRKSRSPKAGLDISFSRRGGVLVSLRVRGHAGFAVAGQDIVCAAASALVLSAAHGLRAHCRTRPQISDTPAQYRLDLPAGGNALAQAVLETTIAGLQAIAAAYPGHVHVTQAAANRARKAARTGPKRHRAKSKAPRSR